MSRSRPARAVLAAIPILLAAAALPAQPAAQRSSGWEWSAGAALSRPLLVDGNGVEVRPGIAPVAGLARVWDRAGGMRVSLGLRGSRASLSIDGPDGAYSAGTLAQGDLSATVERALGRRAAMHAGVALLAGIGPADVQPFLLGGRRMLSPALNLGASARLTTAPGLSASATVQTYRGVDGGAGGDGPVGDAGTVQRLILVVRYGR